MQFEQPQWSHQPSAQRFIFAAGIECSYPTIENERGERRRIDQLEKTGHYEHWRQDLALVRELGIRYLRYGPPYYRIHRGPGSYDWNFTDEVLPEMRRLGIIPILDLCHFGVPDWMGDFQNPDFPRLFAEYAGAFARRYPWIRLYTPINEMYITAEFSAHYGWWNERLQSHKAFVTALNHVVSASLESMIEILKVRPDALFVLAESSEHTHADTPELAARAEMYNQRRFLSLDLLCGHYISSGMFMYLRDNGLSEDQLRHFADHDVTEHCIIGHDYYRTNEHLQVDEDERVGSGEVFGYYVIARHYFERYGLPVMHTETNCSEPDAEHWLWRTWTNIQQLRQDAIAVCGMTWYALVDQVDWDTALREENNRVQPTGLFDLDRNIRPAGRTYKELIRRWRNVPLLPSGPLTITSLAATEREAESAAEPQN